MWRLTSQMGSPQMTPLFLEGGMEETGRKLNNPKKDDQTSVC
ncbi:hypothetical protein [Algoriphagus sp.]|nr:hypothetical protein [Algoriphagus sp.]